MAQKFGGPTSNPNMFDPIDLYQYYASLQVKNSSYFDLRLSTSAFQTNDELNRLLKPADRNLWDDTTSPTETNAAYALDQNSIFIAAGLMQLPLLGAEYPDYVNYGALGALVGHEITHGFDNDGAQYDETGAYHDWWDNGTMKIFDQKTACFVDQFSKFHVADGKGKEHFVNGNKTLGENIADTGGLSAAYNAWKKRDTQHPNQGLPGLERFTNDQLFFLSFALSRCSNQSPDYEAMMMLIDTHSPDSARIIGTTANDPDFREAFNCPVKKPTCELW